MRDVANILPKHFLSLSLEDSFSILPLDKSDDQIVQSPFHASILAKPVKDPLIKRIVSIIARVLQILFLSFLIAQQVCLLESEDSLRAAMAMLATGCLALGLKNGVERLSLLFSSSQQSMCVDEKREDKINTLRRQLLVAQHKIDHSGFDDAREENLDLDNCSEQTLVQILNTPKLDLMRALAKVKAAPICTISHKKILDPKKISFLNTNPRAIYEYEMLSKWINQFSTCPTTRKIADFVIAPHRKAEQIIDRDQPDLGKEVRQQVQSHLYREVKERRRAICEVNGEFGEGNNYLKVK